jgi:hypothetical protein
MADSLDMETLLDMASTDRSTIPAVFSSDPDIARFMEPGFLPPPSRLADSSTSHNFMVPSAVDAHQVAVMPWEEEKSTTYAPSHQQDYSASAKFNDVGIPSSVHPSSFSSGQVDLAMGIEHTIASAAPSQDDNQWQMYLTTSSSHSGSIPSSTSWADGLNCVTPSSSIASLTYPVEEPAFDLSQLALPPPTFTIAEPTQSVAHTIPMYSNHHHELEGVMSHLSVGPGHTQQFITPSRTQYTKAQREANERAYLSELTAPYHDSSSSHLSPFPASLEPLAQSTPYQSPNSPPSRGRSPILGPKLHFAPQLIRKGRGLSGWGQTSPVEFPKLGSDAKLASHISPLPSPALPSSFKLPDTATSSASSESSARPTRLTRHSRSSAISLTLPGHIDKGDTYDSEEDEDDDHSDCYQPSRSPSVDLSKSESLPSSPFIFPDFAPRNTLPKNGRRRTRRGKGKAKGSAALALAVVTEMSTKESGSLGIGSQGSVGGDEESMDEDGRNSRGIQAGRKRKNNPIPLPVPVPHLIKKSRGRKVPYVAPDTVAAESDAAYVDVPSGGYPADQDEKSNGMDDDGETFKPSARGGRKKSNTLYSLGEGGKRTYVCVVPGCGKCFVRGEHLKRHVRSIHTHDKREFSVAVDLPISQLSFTSASLSLQGL